ncbi:MAG: Zn-ribbon domain-containing OB-fold protein [Candidatus Bathyarchaeota archaeon]|nr:Zn-ribbon domain-containing OB-fold protein [Candidatus Bathyarchaeota archaeon]MDH5494845.1 Zn-ribbon domain-containing OB-fold protein [Candidatus Bathyarchaeota archaeon]
MPKQPEPEKIVKEVEYDKKWWDEWVRKGGWRPEGYKIIELEDGPSLNELTPQKFMIAHRPHANMFHHSYGKVSKFFEGLLEGRLLGTKCPKCGLTYCPPRAHCFNPKCRLQETEWIELPKRGTVHSYTIMAIAWPALAHMQPLVGAMVRIEGTNTCLPMLMKDIDPEKVNIDLKVNIHIAEKPKGDLLDVYGTPAEEPRGPKRTEEELKRFRADMELTREWVRRKFGSK